VETESNPSSATDSRSNGTPLLDFKGLAARVPLSERALREAVRRGLIPSILLPGGRKRLFVWRDVEAALRRFTVTT